MRQLRKLEDGKMFQLTAQRSRLQYYTHSKLDITFPSLTSLIPSLTSLSISRLENCSRIKENSEKRWTTTGENEKCAVSMVVENYLLIIF